MNRKWERDGRNSKRETDPQVCFWKFGCKKYEAKNGIGLHFSPPAPVPRYFWASHNASVDAGLEPRHPSRGRCRAIRRVRCCAPVVGDGRARPGAPPRLTLPHPPPFCPQLGSPGTFPSNRINSAAARARTQPRSRCVQGSNTCLPTATVGPGPGRLPRYPPVTSSPCLPCTLSPRLGRAEGPCSV